MEDERELNLREYFATLLLKAKMGEDIKKEALTLIGNVTPRDINIADDSYITRNEYSLFLSSLTDEKELYFLLNSFLSSSVKSSNVLYISTGDSFNSTSNSRHIDAYNVLTLNL